MIQNDLIFSLFMTASPGVINRVCVVLHVLLCTCSGFLLSCRYTFNCVAGETSPSSFVTDLRCVCVLWSWMRRKCLIDGQLPASHTHTPETCLLGEIFHECVCVSVNMWPDRLYVTVHVLGCVGVIVCVCCFIAAVLVWPQRAAAVRCLAPCVFVCHSGSFGFSFS